MKTTILKDVLLPLDLQLFADGGAGSGTGDGGASTGVSGAAAVSQTKGAKSTAPEIKYGIQDDGTQVAAENPATNGVATPAAKDRAAVFEEMIRGEYKDLFDARMQDTVQKRLKSTKETVDRYEALSPVLDLMYKKYGVKDGDVTALSKAIEEDDAFYEDEAMERNMTVEQLREWRKIERENAELRRASAEKERRENADRLYSEWMKQSDAMKDVYPSFDLETELSNPKFLSLLRSNIDVRTAFEVIHKDEIIPAVMRYSAQTVEKKLANSIATAGRRAAENGSSSQGAAVVKSDVSQLTRADRQNIRNQVARGAKIKF